MTSQGFLETRTGRRGPPSWSQDGNSGMSLGPSLSRHSPCLGTWVPTDPLPIRRALGPPEGLAQLLVLS